MMNNNYQGYDFSIESLFLYFNKAFHFGSKNTITINVLSNQIGTLT